MNKERLLKLIEDMKEVTKNLNNCIDILKNTPDNNTTIFIGFGLKQIFVDFFITVENLVSMLLKETKMFKIGIDMKEALKILANNKVIDDEMFIFLNEARLLRNRISHRYKEPTVEELLNFICENRDNLENVIKLAMSFQN